MEKFRFKIGDLLVSREGTIAYVHHIAVNMNGNEAIFLKILKKAETIEYMPYAIVDYKLGDDINAGKYRYYPIVI